MGDRNFQSGILRLVYLSLLKHFGYQNWWPVDWEYHKRKGTNPFDEVVIGAILTQNTSWKNVEKSLKEFKRKGKLSLKFVKEAPYEVLQELVKPAGFYRQKTLYLKEVADFIFSLKGRIPKREELLKVRGIGRETADVILLYAYNQPSFVIDRYTLRWLQRFFGFSADYEGAKRFFENSLRPNVPVYKEFHALIDELAKRYCTKGKPKCEICPLKGSCKEGNLRKERGG
ncbi:MAG: endonuclease [Gammaproteobacteria bacterium]|nr:MAG: endonuclease [Gammaproteobacteria bacterium]